MAIAEQEDEATARDSLGAEFRCSLNGVCLGSLQFLQQAHGFLKECQACRLGALHSAIVSGLAHEMC
jgi:hypothetical protein